MIRSMKDSKIEWAGKIPEHWREIPNKFLFYNFSEKVGDEAEQYQLLSLTTQGVKKKDKNATGGKVPLSYDTYQTVNVGDIIFCLFDLDCSAVFAGVSPYCGMITSAYNVLTPRDAVLYSKYADYWFQYAFSNRYYKLYSKNIRFAVTNDVFGSILTIVPPIAEQKKIADFLDRKCAEIDELVQTEEKMIEELKAYKQSVITEAVTKGLDPAVPMKDSGIDWIGEIPQSWRTMPIKHCCKINLESLKDTEKDDLIINYIDISSADENGNINFVDEITFLNAPSRARRIIRNGDVIISTVRTYLKAIALIDKKYDGFVCSTGFAVLTPLEKVEARFLYYNIYTDSFTSRVSYYSNGISYPAINSSVLATLHITLPSIDEQKQIADYLDDKCAKIDEMIAIRNEQIEQLKDYKKSLIYEYVTGKKEVV